MRKFLIGALLGVALLPIPLHAWSGMGHYIIARIALTRLTPETRHVIGDLLGEEGDLVSVSTWADEIRAARPETYNWHFVDIPYGEAHYDKDRDCRPTERGDCVVAEIARAQTILRDGRAPRAVKSEALKFLIHGVEDLHQPLHSIENDHDRGGNDVHVATDSGRLTNLHAIWDGTIIQAQGQDEETYASALIADLEAHPVPASEQAVNVVQWVEQAHAAAVEAVYRYPGFAAGQTPSSPVVLDAAHRARALKVINRQLQLAGVHLAAILNATLASLGHGGEGR